MLPCVRLKWAGCMGRRLGRPALDHFVLKFQMLGLTMLMLYCRTQCIKYRICVQYWHLSYDVIRLNIKILCNVARLKISYHVIKLKICNCWQWKYVPERWIFWVRSLQFFWARPSSFLQEFKTTQTAFFVSLQTSFFPCKCRYVNWWVCILCVHGCV